LIELTRIERVKDAVRSRPMEANDHALVLLKMAWSETSGNRAKTRYRRGSAKSLSRAREHECTRQARPRQHRGGAGSARSFRRSWHGASPANPWPALRAQRHGLPLPRL